MAGWVCVLRMCDGRAVVDGAVRELSRARRLDLSPTPSHERGQSVCTDIFRFLP